MNITATTVLSLAIVAGTAIAQEEDIQIHDFESTVMKGSPPQPEDVVTGSSFETKHRHRVWAQQHIQELLSTQTIRRGIGAPTTLERQTSHKLINDMAVLGPDGKCMKVKDLLRGSNTDAFLVLHRGKILTEQYFSGMRPDVPHLLYSLTKPISVGVVFNLLAEGHLDEDSPIEKYIPELAKSGYARATVRQLMDMQSGVHYQYSDPVFRDGELLTGRLTSMREDGVHYRAAGLLPRLPDDRFASQYDFLPTLKAGTRDHGSIYCYKCSDPCVLAWACERVTNERFSDLVSKYIWSKLGAEHDALMICDSKGALAANGGMSATLRDLARWGQMHVQKGTYNGNTILAERYLDDLLSNADLLKITDDSFGALPLDGFAYRSQYPVLSKSEAYVPGGAWGQICYIHPESETVIVKFATCSSIELYLAQIRAFQEITRQLSKRPGIKRGSE